MRRSLLSRKLAAGVLSLFALFVALTNKRNQAKADSPPAVDPRLWAQEDLRQASKQELLRWATKHALVCGEAPGPMATGMLFLAGNKPLLPAHTATLLACVKGSPSSVTCDQLRQCNGTSVETSNKQSMCDGGLLRSHLSVSGKKQPVTISCQAQGEQCFQGPLGAFCGSALCDADEAPHRCDGDNLFLCMEGVRVKFPCGQGLTCGESPGTNALDCIGKGEPCTGDSSCNGSDLHSCVMDAWGKGRTQIIPCASWGLTCQQGVAENGKKIAVCGWPSSGECIPKDPPRCENGNVVTCVGRSWVTQGCNELGLAGKCVEKDAKVRCE